MSHDRSEHVERDDAVHDGELTDQRVEPRNGQFVCLVIEADHGSD